jgi:S1-C subfamily serine protease
MEALSELGGLDIVLIVGIVLVAITGYRQGLIVGAAGLAGFILGGIAGLWAAPRVLEGWDEGLGTTAAGIGIVLGSALLAQVLAGVAAGRLRERVTWHPARVADAAGGSLASVAGLLVGVWLLASILVQSFGPPVSGWVERSRLLAAVDAAIPADAGQLLDGVEGLLDSSGFPRVFQPFAGELITPVDAPDPAVADPVVARSKTSLVKVEGVARSCRAGLEGSGFVYADGLVMTNAHVVAGVSEPTVSIAGTGPAVRATVVVFDPTLDVAVLRIPRLNAPALGFASTPAERGQDAVVAGFPEDGPLTATPARVRGSVRAIGEDIYGEQAAAREVYALRAEVRPGNSGGPLLDAAGAVLGVVFAASTEDAETGYALTAAAVQEAARAGLSARSEVSTGPCA